MSAFEFAVLVSGGIVTIAGAGAVLVKAFVRAVKATVEPRFERLEQSHNRFAELMERQQTEQDEDFYSEVRSIKVRLDDLSGSVGWLEQEMRPNHGSSLRDAVDRLERMMTEHLDAS